MFDQHCVRACNSITFTILLSGFGGFADTFNNRQRLQYVLVAILHPGIRRWRSPFDIGVISKTFCPGGRENRVGSIACRCVGLTVCISAVHCLTRGRWCLFPAIVNPPDVRIQRNKDVPNSVADAERLRAFALSQCLWHAAAELIYLILVFNLSDTCFACHE